MYGSEEDSSYRAHREGRGGNRVSVSCALDWLASGASAVFLRLAVAGLSLSACLLLTLLSQLGPDVYLFTGVPAWYFCNLCIMTYPFLSIFHYEGLSPAFVRRVWLSLLSLSLFVSSTECIAAHELPRPWSWLTGTTLFVLAGSCGLPLFFGARRRSVCVASARHRVVDTLLPQRHLDPLEAAVHARKQDGLAAGGIFAYRPGLERQSTEAGFVAAVSVIFGLVVVWAGYLWPRHYAWGYVYILLPFQVGVVLLDEYKRLQFNFSYLIFYVCVAVRIPDFLGSVLLHYFHDMERAVRARVATRYGRGQYGGTPGYAQAQAAAEAAQREWARVLRFALVVVYILVMQLYLQLLMRVVSNMTQSYGYTAFIFIGQLYFYYLWYLMLGTDQPLDWLFWAMVLVSNLNYVFINTRAYCDDCGRVSRAARRGCYRAVVGCFAGLGLCPARALWTPPTPTNKGRPLPGGGAQGSGGGDGSGGAGIGIDADRAPHPHIHPHPSLMLPSPRKGSASGGRGRGRGGDSPLSPLPGTPRRQTVAASPVPVRRDAAACAPPPAAEPLARGYSGRLRAASLVQPPDPSEESAETAEERRNLIFLVKLAEQDNLADTVALVMVPSLLLTFSWLGVEQQTIRSPHNLCLRYLVMCCFRAVSARLADAVFAVKIGAGHHTRAARRGHSYQHPGVRSKWRRAVHAFLFTRSTRKLRLSDGRTLEDLMRHEFQEWWAYLVVVSVSVTYACFGRGDSPVRYALFRLQATEGGAAAADAAWSATP
eukprot:g4017.t1